MQQPLIIDFVLLASFLASQFPCDYRLLACSKINPSLMLCVIAIVAHSFYTSTEASAPAVHAFVNQIIIKAHI